MLCKECPFFTEINGEFVSDCETARGCDLPDQRFWDEKYLKEHKIEKDSELAKQEADRYICELKSRMDLLWERYDESQRSGEGDDLDDDYFMFQNILKDLGIEYEPEAKRR